MAFTNGSGGKHKPRLCAAEGRWPDRIRGRVGGRDGPQRRGGGDRRHHHHLANRTLRAPPPDAGDRRARRLRFLARFAKVDGETAATLIAPARDNLLDVYAVSDAVNRVANDAPDLLTPVAPVQWERARASAREAHRDPKKDDGQASLR